MPYFSLQAGIALCDMDEVNGSTAVIPYSHVIWDSDWLIAGAKPRPGEAKLSAKFRENRDFFNSLCLSNFVFTSKRKTLKVEKSIE